MKNRTVLENFYNVLNSQDFSTDREVSTLVHFLRNLLNQESLPSIEDYQQYLRTNEQYQQFLQDKTIHKNQADIFLLSLGYLLQLPEMQIFDYQETLLRVCNILFNLKDIENKDEQDKKKQEWELIVEGIVTELGLNIKDFDQEEDLQKYLQNLIAILLNPDHKIKRSNENKLLSNEKIIVLQLKEVFEKINEVYVGMLDRCKFQQEFNSIYFNILQDLTRRYLNIKQDLKNQEDDSKRQKINQNNYQEQRFNVVRNKLSGAGVKDLPEDLCRDLARGIISFAIVKRYIYHHFFIGLEQSQMIQFLRNICSIESNFLSRVPGADQDSAGSVAENLLNLKDILCIYTGEDKIKFIEANSQLVLTVEDVQTAVEQYAESKKLEVALSYNDEVQDSEDIVKVMEILPPAAVYQYAIFQIEQRKVSGAGLASIIKQLSNNEEKIHCAEKFSYLINDGEELSQVLRVLPKPKKLTYLQDHESSIKTPEYLFELSLFFPTEERLEFLERHAIKIKTFFELDQSAGSLSMSDTISYFEKHRSVVIHRDSADEDITDRLFKAVSRNFEDNDQYTFKFLKEFKEELWITDKNKLIELFKLFPSLKNEDFSDYFNHLLPVDVRCLLDYFFDLDDKNLFQIFTRGKAAPSLAMTSEEFKKESIEPEHLNFLMFLNNKNKRKQDKNDEVNNENEMVTHEKKRYGFEKK